MTSIKKLPLAVLLACLTTPALAAAEYPDKPIRLVVPYAVGGTTDIIARVVGNKLGAQLGQSVIIENKPGAGGSIGSAYAAKQPADGYTLAVAAKQRLKVLPDVPTYAEAGLPAMNNPSWFGLAAPAGTPAPVLDKLNAAVRQALADLATVDAIERQGAVPSPMSREAFGALIAQSNSHWKSVVEDIKFEKMQ